MERHQCILRAHGHHPQTLESPDLQAVPGNTWLFAPLEAKVEFSHFGLNYYIRIPRKHKLFLLPPHPHTSPPAIPLAPKFLQVGSRESRLFLEDRFSLEGAHMPLLDCRAF